MEHQSFDKKIKAKLEKATITPPEHNWEAIEARVPRYPLLKKYSFGLGISLLLSSLIFTFYNKQIAVTIPETIVLQQKKSIDPSIHPKVIDSTMSCLVVEQQQVVITPPIAKKKAKPVRDKEALIEDLWAAILEQDQYEATADSTIIANSLKQARPSNSEHTVALLPKESIQDLQISVPIRIESIRNY